jgi:hypothetical protein
MKRSQIKDEYIRQYVLGTHDPESQKQFEERLLTDEKLLDQLSIVEDEVVCDYLAGSLSELERDKFENRFLRSAAGKQKLQFFSAIKNHVDNLSPSIQRTPLPLSWKRFLPAFLRGESPWLRLSFAMAAVILVFVGLFAFFRNSFSEHGPVFTTALVPGQVKNIGGRKLNVVEVPAGTGVINLQLAIGEVSAESFHASIFTDTGEEVFTEGALQTESGQDGRFVSLRVPANVLTAGDYRLRLKAYVAGSGLEEVASYSFRVIK